MAACGPGSAQARHDSSGSRTSPLTRQPTGSEASASIQAVAGTLTIDGIALDETGFVSVVSQKTTVHSH